MAKSTAPQSASKLKSLKSLAPLDSRPEQSQVTLASFRLPANTEPRIVRDWKESDTYRIEADVRHAGARISPPHERIPAIALGKDILRQFSSISELEGFRPAQSALKYYPDASEIDRKRHGKLARGEDVPTNVFDTDDRYIFNDTSYPWRMTGRIWTATGACTGCAIGPRLVLTASHCIDWQAGGGAGWVNFSPAYYNGNGPWGQFSATQVISWNRAEGGLTDLETAFDYVVLVMNARVGDSVGYAGYRTYDSAWNGQTVWQHVGYPGDLTATQRPAFQGDCVISSASSESLSGQSGLVLGHFNDTTGGHSGGPIWGWWENESYPRVVGVQSAGAAVPARNTSGDNEFGGGQALSALISYARSNYP